MKKLFTLICALVGFTATTNAATVDDLKVCKHSYVLIGDDWNANGTAKLPANTLIGDGYFLTGAKGNDKSTSKGKSNPAETLEDGTFRYGEAFAAKYGEYGEHYNSLRLKNAQDVLAMKITAGSKLIFLLQGNNKKGTEARIPKIAKDKDLKEVLNSADDPAAVPDNYADGISAGYKYEWTADDDYTIYIGSYNGDMFVGYIIVEANEPAGTPSVKVGEQKFENGLFYREVTCKPNTYEMFDEVMPTIVTYTVDGSTPDHTSPVYTEPIKCYKETTVKFQAYVSYGTDEVFEDAICTGAENEVVASFSFDAPTIEAEGGNVTIKSAYADQGADVKYFASYGDEADKEGASFTLTKSSTVEAYVKISNGTYGEFTSNKATTDVYVLNPIKEKKTIAVTAGTAVIDTESTDEVKPYIIEGGEISADEMDFFVKDLTFAALANADEAKAKYQVPVGQEAYIQMSNTNITFLVAEGDSVFVKVTCSKNACKNIDSEEVKDRACMVNVDGTNYGWDDILVGGNVITFELKSGYHTFKKYSGTGNILISSIEIEPIVAGGIDGVQEDKAATSVQKVLKNGKLVIIKNGVEYNVAGVQVK